jgi:enoyl-CoA hydratase
MWHEERHRRVVMARFSRPPMSYFTDEDVEQLDALCDAWLDPDVGAIVLAGAVEGKFITHFDVDSILLKQAQPEGPVEAPLRSRRVHALTRKLNDLPKPVIAALNGDAMGWGFELALAADVRVGERAGYRYGLIEVRLGIVPGGSGLTRMAKLVGSGRAMLLALTAKAMTPEQAHAYGLLEELSDDAVATAVEIATSIASMPPTAVAMAKRIVHAADLPLAYALDLELESVYRSKRSPDAAAMLEAYLDLPLERRRDYLDD